MIIASRAFIFANCPKLASCALAPSCNTAVHRISGRFDCRSHVFSRRALLRIGTLTTMLSVHPALGAQPKGDHRTLTNARANDARESAAYREVRTALTFAFASDQSLNEDA